MTSARKERHGAVEVADPDLGGTGIEKECAFFVDLGRGVRRRKNLDADFRCAIEKDRILLNLGAFVSEPCNIGSLDSIGGRNGAFSEGDALRQQLCEDSGDSSLAAGVTSSGRWTHDDVSVPIGLDPIGELGELRVSHELAPPGKVETCL